MMFLNLLKIKELLSQQSELELGKQSMLTFHEKRNSSFNERGLFDMNKKEDQPNPC